MISNAPQNCRVIREEPIKLAQYLRGEKQDYKVLFLAGRCYR